jgi:cell division protease FtsH
MSTQSTASASSDDAPSQAEPATAGQRKSSRPSRLLAHSWSPRPQRGGTQATPPASPPSAPAQGESRGPNWQQIAAFLVAVVVWNAILTLLFGGGSASAQIPYSEFVTQAQQGNVSQVTFNSQTISGTFRQAIVWPEPSAAASAAASNATPGSASAATPASYQGFTTVMPPTGDPALLPLLQEHGVTVDATDTSSSGSMLWSIVTLLVTSVLPAALFIVFLFYLSRQMQRGQQGLFGFGGSKARLYDAEKPSVTFADVAGEDEAKTELAEVVDFLRNRERYLKLGARLPRGLLLIGPPGTGKTLLARAVAGEANVPFFSISASEFVEMFVGVGASRVRDLFEKAKKTSPSIVFVDEIDAVGRQRGTGMGGGNDEREQTLNQLLSEMDGFDAETNVVVIAATNRPDVLDSALLRPGRFDRQVTVGYPDRTGREAILRIHTKGIPLSPDVDLATLARATAGFSGADLANLANEAALMAARQGRTTVGMDHFEESIDKVLLGTRQAGLIDPQERRMVAYHEGGHALVALLTPGADPVQKVTIVPHGQALGVTEQRPDEDRRDYSRDYLLTRLAVMLGGRAAEEVVFGQPSTGAQSDLKGATDLARRMVGLWGMSEELGPVSYGVGETHPFLGREMADAREYSETTAARIDAAVKELIDNARLAATNLLRDHRATLDELATELVGKETVSAARLAEIAGGAASAPEAAAARTSDGRIPKAAAAIQGSAPTAGDSPNAK